MNTYNREDIILIPYFWDDIIINFVSSKFQYKKLIMKWFDLILCFVFFGCFVFHYQDGSLATNWTYWLFLLNSILFACIGTKEVISDK